MKIYYGLVHKDADSAYGISFPDLPGCFAASDEETDILEAAQTALVLYAQDGEVLADPRSFPELQSDSTVKVELAQGAVMVAVPLISVERKARYNVMLDVWPRKFVWSIFQLPLLRRAQTTTSSLRR